MCRVSIGSREFSPNWWLIGLGILGIIITAKLGFWQLSRAEEKKSMLVVSATATQKHPVLWTPGQKVTQYEKRMVKGSYLPFTFFLDNQFHHHQVGYDVLTPFELLTGEIILIDRGFIAKSSNSLPQISKLPSETIQLTGQIYYPPTKSVLLGLEYEKKGDAVWLVERINTKTIANFLHKTIIPFIIRLDKHEAHGFVRQWSVVSMPPERHYAYAVQWFAIALVIILLIIGLSFRKV